MPIEELLLRLGVEWMIPRRPGGREGEGLSARCTVRNGPAQNIPTGMPPKLAELWNASAGARLFEDPVYGQWGLIIGSPDEARDWTRSFREERPAEYRTGDLIIGTFLGDTDLLLIRTAAEAEDFGALLVVEGIGTREGAYPVGVDLESFLDVFARCDGDKFWERHDGVKQFTATAVAAEEMEDLNSYVLVMAEMRDGDGQRLEVQRSLIDDEQDIELGMDTYCLCTESGATHQGGVVVWSIRGTILDMRLDLDAAESLGVYGFIVDLPVGHVGEVRSALGRMLGPEHLMDRAT